MQPKRLAGRQTAQPAVPCAALGILFAGRRPNQLPISPAPLGLGSSQPLLVATHMEFIGVDAYQQLRLAITLDKAGLQLDREEC